MLLHVILSLLLCWSHATGCIFEDGLYRAKLIEKGQKTSQAIIVDIEGCLILRIHYPNKTMLSVKSEELDDSGHGVVRLPSGQKMEVLVNIQEPVSYY